MAFQFTWQQWVILSSLLIAVVLVYVLVSWFVLSSSPTQVAQPVATVTLTPTPLPTSTLTPTPSRTPTSVPTQTPVLPTATMQPSPSSTATLVVPTATRTLTRRPSPTATAKPVTYKYKAINQGCEHSGQTFIQGKIYDKTGGLMNGVFVVVSGGGPDGAIADKRQSGDDGDGSYSSIVDANGPATGQKRWVWIVEVLGEFRMLSNSNSTITTKPRLAVVGAGL